MSLGAFTALWAARWPTFPLVLDPYYHLLIAQQVADANGPIAYEWWQHAPIGRPHLYPPILHVGLASLLQLGASPLIAIRCVSVGLLPGLLLSLYLVGRRLLAPSIALACLWLAMVPFCFHLHSAVVLAATLAMIELLWLLDAVERGRWGAVAVLLALLCYTHLGLPWISVLTLGVYGAGRAEIRPTLRKAWLGLALALPWWWHLLVHRNALHPVPRHENDLIEVVPLMVLAAVLGLVVCWRRKGRWLLPIACWLGFSILAWGFRFRWLSGEGVLPLILLGGVGIDWLARRLCGDVAGGWRHVLTTLAIIVVVGLSPTLARREGGWKLLWTDSAPFHLLGSPWAQPKELETSLAVPSMQRLARLIALNSQPREILWSNAPYALGLVSALAHRPMSSAMLNEVGASEPFNPVVAAQMIVWFKFEPASGEIALQDLSRLPLTRVFEDDLAILLRRRGSVRRARGPSPVVPLWLAAGLTLGMVGYAAWDAGRLGHSRVTPV